MRPIEVVPTEAAAMRAARWLQRAHIPVDVVAVDDAYEVRVPKDRQLDANVVLGERHRGLAPIPTSRPSPFERVFNVETAGTLVFAFAGVLAAIFVVYTAYVVAVGLGAVVSIALVVAGLAYFNFSGEHGAVPKPKRLSKRAGPVVQERELDVKYRHAWVRDQMRRGRENKPR